MRAETLLQNPATPYSIRVEQFHFAECPCRGEEAPVSPARVPVWQAVSAEYLVAESTLPVLAFRQSSLLKHGQHVCIELLV